VKSKFSVHPWVRDANLEALLNSLHDDGYAVRAMFRNSPNGGGEETTTVVAELI
jgi:hypothetical protein